MHRFTGGEDVNMYCTTSITSPGKPTLSDSKALKLTDKPFQLKLINKIDDIPGTQTFNKWNKFATKPQFNAAVDLPESLPKSPIRTRNVPDRALMVSDIDGAQYSASGGMDRTNRCVDPLQPEYKIPSFNAPMSLFDAPAQKVPRDVLAIDDIEGTRSNMFGKTKNSATRNNLEVGDIDGAQADYNGFKSVRTRFEVALNKSRNFGGSASPVGMSHEDYNPVTFPSPPKFADRTMRRSNVVEPVYTVNGITIADDPRYTKPKRNPAFVKGGTFSLTTQDIVGATSTNSPYKKERKEVRNIMNTADVQGAQADTVVHSIVTDRMTCPLFPVYKSLDDGSPINHLVSSLVPKNGVKDASIRLAQKYHEATQGPSSIASQTGASVVGSKATPIMTPQNNTPERSPIGSARSGFISPVRHSDVRSDSTEGATGSFNHSGLVPRLPLQTGGSVPNTGRSGGKSGQRSGQRSGRESSRINSRREEIDAVRNLPV